MSVIHPTDTICALATPAGGAIALIRISGSDAISIASGIFSKPILDAAANTVHFGIIRSETETLDEVLLALFRAPHSYTGEDSVEISCHGSRYVIQKLLELLVQKGCRLAEPGEYTRRAYLNGKMDLSQAEAVADLIASSNQATHRLAISQMRGEISTQLTELREHLLRLTSLIELELDFSDHEDLEFADRSELLQLAQTIEAHIRKLTQTFATGQALKQGIPVAIVGKTNVGKSTLLNTLLRDDRAIVSDVHGTTRDTIEETLDIHGVTFRFIDTAGLRSTSDQVERIGIERTLQKIHDARIVIWLLDTPPTQAEADEMHQLLADKRCLCVYNKADLLPPTVNRQPSVLYISAKHGIGIDPLKEHIFEAAGIEHLNSDEVIISNARHYDALLRAHNHLTRVLQGLQTQLSGDLLAEDLRLTLDALADITGGQITSQETLNNIFSHFCVGK